MQVIDAEGAKVDAFVNRLRGVALIARAHKEIATANALNSLAEALGRSRGDMRPQLYAGLDRAQAAVLAA